MFGEDRLHRAIAAAGADTPVRFVAAVMNAVERFAAGAPQDDDLTILAVRYSGQDMSEIWKSGNVICRFPNSQISQFPNQPSICLAIVCSCRLDVPS